MIKNFLNKLFSGVDWKNQLVSFFVVFLGITIAFSLDNWNSTRKEKALEKEYLSSLSADLSKDIYSLQGISDTTRYFLGLNQKLIREISAQDHSDDSLFFYIMSMYSFAKFNPIDNTYSALVSSGNIAIIKDFHLRQKIIALYNQYMESLVYFDNVYETVLLNNVQPYVFEKVDFSNYPVVGNQDFLQDQYFINLAFSSNYYLSTKIGLCDSALFHSNKLMDLLNNSLQK